MNIDLSIISNKSGLVDSSKIDEYFSQTNAKKLNYGEKFYILNAIGYNEGIGMTAMDFVRRYVFVKTFMDLDKDRSGYLDKQELKEFLGSDTHTEEMKDMFKEIDMNGDGKISVDELLSYLESEIKLAELIKF